MSRSARPRVRPYTWRKAGQATPGAMVSIGDRQLFIAAADLIPVADALVDHAEQLEQENR